MATEVKDVSLKELNQAVIALREEVQKANPNQEIIDKINKTLDYQESKNQEVVKQMQEAKKREEDQKERIDTLELELSRKVSAGDGKGYHNAEEYKALHSFCLKGEHIEHKDLLRTDSDIQGGVLVMSEMDSVIIKDITEIDALRSVARVRTISKKTLDLPKRKTNMTAAYEGEAEQDQKSNQTYGSESVTTFRQSVTVEITQDMLMDSAFNMESEILQDASEAFAFGEGNGFIAGTGVKQPQGIISHAGLQANARPTAVSGVLSANDVILLTGDLKVGYNPVYLLNRMTLAQLRTLRADAVSAADGAGNFLWQPGLNGPVSNTINGFPYLIMPSMQNVAANAYPIAFGDFRRGYTIIDRTGTSVVRDALTRKREAIIEFTIHRWNTGQVVQQEAIKLLQVTA